MSSMEFARDFFSQTVEERQENGVRVNRAHDVYGVELYEIREGSTWLHGTSYVIPQPNDYVTLRIEQNKITWLIGTSEWLTDTLIFPLSETERSGSAVTLKHLTIAGTILMMGPIQWKWLLRTIHERSV